MSYDIGPRLRRYREAQNLSQKELAKRIGVSNSRVSNWEQGINRPDVDILADICTVLNISPSELLDVHLSPDDLSDQERKVIIQYRRKPELQRAVNILLGVETENET
jgi:transcriptional regulator with XRE-family HTH domain